MNKTTIRKGTIMKKITLALLGLACLMAVPQVADARYRDGMNLYQYVGSNPVQHLDPYGEAILIMGGRYDLNAAGTGIDLLRTGSGWRTNWFARKIRSGFQEIIGDCAKLSVEKAGTHSFNGATLVQFRLTYSKEKASCKCDDCWQLLKAAIDNPAPVIQVRFLQDTSNAYAWTSGPSRDVLIHPGVNVKLPEQDRHGNYKDRRAPFSIVLWHEAVGHAHLGYTHPPVPQNTLRGWDGIYIDPTIAEENRARNCTRLLGKRYGGFFGLFGRKLGDRHPTYYP